MLRYTCPTCSTVIYLRDSMVGRQTWCPSCQNDVRVQPRSEPPAPARKPDTSRRAAFMTSLLVLPLLGIIAWALSSFVPESTPDLAPSPADANPAAVTEANIVRPRVHYSNKKTTIARSIHRGGD
jgi:DNA-directed RNA polymerase subunit RPC12/RpoP